MQWEIEVNQQKITCGPATALESLLKLTPEAIKEGQGYPCVVDLRKTLEISEKPAPRLKELGVRYVQIPVTAETFSEQDVDAVRREFARGWGRLLIVSQKGVRATFMALAHSARAQGWSQQQALEKCPEMKSESLWVEPLQAYLLRHRVGTA